MFLMFIAAVDLFNGVVVCSGEALMRFWCALGNERVPRDGDYVRIMGYIGINSSILLVTAMSVDRLLAVLCPHFYHRRVKARKLVIVNTAIVVFSTIFSLIPIAEEVPLNVYLSIDIHLHTTFPLVTTTVAYLGIYLVLKKRSRVDFKRETRMRNNSVLQEIRRATIAQRERKFASISFSILLFMILSLVPYFVVIIIEVNCNSCGYQTWFHALRESCVIFLFLNSAVNPLLTTFRINELKQSVRIVFHLRRQENANNHVESASCPQNSSVLNSHVTASTRLETISQFLVDKAITKK